MASGAFSLLLLFFLIVVGWIVWNHYAPDVPVIVQTGDAPSPVKQAEPVAETAAAEASPPPGQSLTEMAERGDARAQYLLGKTYLNNQGTAKDLALAIEWFEKAASQGNADAQFALGLIYLTGRGAVQHYEVAFQWFEKAAMQNHAEAQYRLGTMLRNGDGVAEDKVKAYVWFNLAAAQGHDRAADARDTLLPKLTDEQIGRGQREAHAWRPVTTQKEPPLDRRETTSTHTPAR